MPRTNLWDRSVPRVELDRRSREARLRFERIDQLFIVRGYGDAFSAAAAVLFVHGRQIRRVAARG
jgi:hypothetical protein